MYSVETDAEAFDQVAALPGDALPFYAQALVTLEVAPWNGLPLNDKNPDGQVRELLFGARYQGKITYLILDDQRRVDVLRVVWIDLWAD